MRTFRRARVVLDSVMNKAVLPPLDQESTVESDDVDRAMLLNAARMSYGDMLESAARLRASRHCTCDELPVHENSIRVFSRLMVDSYLIACWTSAHAEWIDIQSNADRLARTFSMNPNDLLVPRANMHLVPYAVSTLPDLGGLLERLPSCSTASKSSGAMLTLLARCTNAGARGWDSTLNSALHDTYGCTKILFGVMAATCTGMHTLIHPANRPCWEDRMRIHRLLCTMETKALLTGSGVASKEMVRMYTATVLSNMPATREAMRSAGHPVGQLIVSPFELPPVALVAAMTRMLRSAMFMCVIQTVVPDVACFAKALFKSINDECKRRKSLHKNRSSPVKIAYNSSWIGRSRPLCDKGKQLIEAATHVFIQTFKSEFIPMWYYQSTQGHRVSRLDISRHSELHTNNPSLVLCRALSEAQSLYAQRLVLRDNRFGIMTLNQAVDMLGINRDSLSENGQCDIIDMEAEDAAMVLTMACVSAKMSHILAYNLGENTRRMQVDAMCRRLMQPRLPGETDEQVISRLPTTATHLMLCVECRRVANACQDGSGNDVTFNEIGVSSSMLKVDGELSDAHLRCSKRSSAALRTALQMEENSRCMKGNHIATSTAIVKFDTKSMMSRMHRDIKTVYDQVGEAMACGDQPLVTVRIPGRVINVFGKFYSLCCYCGCLCTVEQNNRYGSEICCLRCDFKMLYRNTKPPAIVKRTSPPVKCRYCGREGPFKIVRAPLDSIGHNKNLPKPLRWVAFCPTHWKPWVQSALDVMSMQEVFAHISSRCRPIFAAARGKRAIKYNEDSTKDECEDVPVTKKAKVTRVLRKLSGGRKIVSKR